MSQEIKKTFYESGNLKDQRSYLNDVRHGEDLCYHENGQLHFKCDFVNGVQQGVVVSFDENGNKIKKSNILNGDYEGEQIEWYSNGIIKAKRIYKKDIAINLREYDEDGILIKESISEILVQSHTDQAIKNDEDVFGKGNISKIKYQLFASELSLKEWNDGNLIKEELQFEFEKPPNIKALDESLDSSIRTNYKIEDEDFWWNWSRKKHRKYSSVKTYYDNGKLKMQSQFYIIKGDTKYFHGPVKEYFSSGNLMCEGNYKIDEKDGLWVFYFETGKIKSEQIFNQDTCESLKEWDGKGKLVKESLLKNGDSRIVFMHEVMTKGGFSFELKDGTELEVFGQRHSFVEIEEFYEDSQWNSDGDKDYIDEFYLTGYEEGYIYDEADLNELFDLPKGSYPEWDYNGWGEWEETAEDWNYFKSKFSVITSKDQFEID